MKRPEQKKLACGAAAATLLILFALWLFLGQKVQEQGSLKEITSSAAAEDVDAEETQEDEIVVHITGAVVSPGVVRLPAGARLMDAVDAAGGLTPDADTDRVNLAALLSDADKIHIYSIQEAQASSEGVAADGKVNINTATLEELMTLPGVGEAIGGNIIAYRDKNGAFKSLEELKQVDRIGDKSFERLKEHICL